MAVDPFTDIRNYGVPLHLIRELYETFRNFRIRIADYVRYRRITSNMNERFPDATAEELNAWVLYCSIGKYLVDSIIKIVVIYILLYSGVMLHVLFAVRRWLQQRSCFVGICSMCIV